MKNIKKYSLPIIITLLFFIFSISLIPISSSSMEPKIKSGNLVFTNKLSYIFSNPQRGEIIMYSYKNQNIVNRIIGLPGDNISFKNGYILINNQICDETAYISNEAETNCSKEFIVPDNCYFVLGDNRNTDNDSRFYTEPYISRKNIKGKYIGQIHLK